MILVLEYLSVFLTGSLVYGLLELVWRGLTHWTMLLTGGLCGCLLYVISNHSGLHYFKKLVLGMAAITTVEFMVGVLVNIVLGWRVWDYSSQALHLVGQICPRFCGYWFLLCIPAFFVCRVIFRLFSLAHRAQERA